MNLDVDKSLFHRLNQKRCCGVNSHLAHETGAVAVYGLVADAELVGDLRVGKSAGNALKNFDLPAGKLALAICIIENFLRICGNYLPALKNICQAVADFLRVRVLEKDAVNSSLHELVEDRRRRYAGDNGKTRFRRPALGFRKYFQSIGSRHGKVNQGAVRLQFLDGSNCLDPVAGAADYFKSGHGRDEIFHTLSRERMVVCNKNRFGQAAPANCSPRLQHAPKLYARPILAYLFVLFLTTISYAEDRVVDLQGPVSPEQLQSHIDFYLDPDWQLDVDDMIGDYSEKFRPIETKVPDFGYTKSRIWLRIKLKNDTDDEDEWRLYFQENFKQLFDVFVVREDGRLDHVLAQDLESGFDTRPIQFAELVAPAKIEPGETVTVFIRYWSEGSSNLQTSIETAATFAGFAAAVTAKNFIYYGMMLLLILAAFLAILVYRHRVFAAYIASSTSTLLFLMHSDGVAFQYLWPDFPGFNSIASIVTGSGIIIFATNYARVFLMTARRHPVVDKILLAVILLTLLVDCGGIRGRQSDYQEVAGAHVAGCP